MATVSPAELKRRTIAAMEDDLKISGKQASDFIESCAACVEEAIANGDAVNLFGLAKLTPKFRASRRAAKNQPDPFNPGQTRDIAARPASITVKATALKRAKDAAPAANSKAGKAVRR